MFLKRRQGSGHKISSNGLTKSCYVLLLITKGNHEEIDDHGSMFWWSPGGSTKGMHWKSWDKVCENKDEGGLGFKDISDFNTAMLGKHLWRLIENPHTLFSRVFKRRYYMNASPPGADPIILSVTWLAEYCFS